MMSTSKCDDHPKRRLFLGIEIPSVRSVKRWIRNFEIPTVSMAKTWVKKNEKPLAMFLFVALIVVVYEITKKRVPSSYRYGMVLHNKEDLCPKRIRAGTKVDGGWWLCGKSTVPSKNCVVYSFGIHNNFHFDHYLANQGCDTHGFDPSPYGLRYQKEYEKVENSHYHSNGIGSESTKVYQPGMVPFRWPGLGYLGEGNSLPWKLQSLPTIMQELGHDKVTILKMDVEGAEWFAIEDIAKANWDELYLELHFPPGDYQIMEDDANGDLILIRTPNGPGRRQYTARNTNGPIDRIALLEEINTVADMFYWESNPTCRDSFQAECIEIYFKRKAKNDKLRANKPKRKASDWDLVE